MFCMYSCLESVGEKSEIDGGFWWWRVQADGLCGCSSNRETHRVEARWGMDRAIGTLFCPFYLMKRLWLKEKKNKMYFLLIMILWLDCTRLKPHTDTNKPPRIVLEEVANLRNVNKRVPLKFVGHRLENGDVPRNTTKKFFFLTNIK